MQAGRELDQLIAEKVVFYTRKHVIQECDDPYYNFCQICGHENTKFDLEYSLCEAYPKYSTDIAAAWEVIAKIDGDWSIVGQEGVGWEATVVPANGGPDRFEMPFQANADTAPHAICLAALKSVGIEF